LGAVYRYSGKTRIGLVIKDIFKINESWYSSIKAPIDANFNMPLFVSMGYSTIFQTFRISIDNELIYGNYGGIGKKEATFWILRGGVEKKVNDLFTLRGGLVLPIIARTSTLGNVRNDLPWPKFGGAFGVGINYEHCIIDIAVYGDPAKSYVNRDIYIKAVASLTIII